MKQKNMEAVWFVRAWTGSYGGLETDHCGRWHPCSGKH